MNAQPEIVQREWLSVGKTGEPTARVSIQTGTDKLICSVHGLNKICHHIQEVLTFAFDADEVWDEGDPIQVPMFSEANIWVQVQLGAMDGGLFKRINLWTGRIYEYVGILSPGEGRMAIRQQIAVWMQSMWTQELVEQKAPGFSCKSTGHSYEAQKNLMNIMARGPQKDEPEYWANYWSLKMDGVCASCRSFDFTEDVVEL